MSPSIKTQFRRINGLSIRCAESEPRLASAMIERPTIISAKALDQIVALLEAAGGQPEIADFCRTTRQAASCAELERTIEKAVERAGLMLFAEFDHGAIVRTGTGRD